VTFRERAGKIVGMLLESCKENLQQLFHPLTVSKLAYEARARIE